MELITFHLKSRRGFEIQRSESANFVEKLLTIKSGRPSRRQGSSKAALDIVDIGLLRWCGINIVNKPGTAHVGAISKAQK